MLQWFKLTIEKDKIDAYELGVKIIAKSNIVTTLKNEADPAVEDKLDNIDELISAIQAFVESEDEMILDEQTGEEIALRNKTLDVFVQQTSLLSETYRGDKNDDNTVSLMTIHSSKGLEIFLCLCCRNWKKIFSQVLCVLVLRLKWKKKDAFFMLLWQELKRN